MFLKTYKYYKYIFFKTLNLYFYFIIFYLLQYCTDYYFLKLHHYILVIFINTFYFLEKFQFVH